jgi:GNAT superfamily N-acetyltransferase
VLAVERLTGARIEAALEALARLRIEVFREFPYLYEGSLDYERGYLREFASSSRSTLVIARDHQRVVGASTATPLLEHGEATSCAEALLRADVDPARVYYFGESVLQRAYRGRGLGHAFFDQREQSAREYGFTLASFCAVQRPADHPAHPHDYAPHDAFWTRRGYRILPQAVATFSWRDLGEQEESAKPMVFWIKEL